jgi:hypothetical protein
MRIPAKAHRADFFSNGGPLIIPLSYRMGELSGWFYQLSTGSINKIDLTSKNREANVLSFSCAGVVMKSEGL